MQLKAQEMLKKKMKQMNNQNLKKWKIEKLTNNVKSNSVNIDLIEKVPFY